MEVYTEISKLFNSMKNQFKSKEQVKFIHEILEAIPIGIFVKDVEGVYKYCNKSFCEFIGYKKDEIIGLKANEIWNKEFIDIYEKNERIVLNKRQVKEYEAPVMCKNGQLKYASFVQSILKEKNKLIGTIGVIHDITERKKTDSKVIRLLKLKECILKINNDIINIKDRERMFRVVLENIYSLVYNGEFAAAFVIDDEGYLKMISYIGYDKVNVDNFRIKFEDSFMYKKVKFNPNNSFIMNNIDKLVYKGFPRFFQNKENKIIKSSLITPILLEDKIYGFINIDSSHNNVFDDIDIGMMEYLKNQLSISITNRVFYDKIMYLSKFDKLTGIYNRNYFEKTIKLDIDNNNSFCLVVFDLNNLKYANDNFGHLTGDRCIKQVVDSLKLICREKDSISRFGGDEFVGIFHDISPKELVEEFDYVLRQLKNSPIEIDNEQIICSFSYGMAEFPKDSCEYRQLFKIADYKMYENKNKYKQLGNIEKISKSLNSSF